MASFTSLGVGSGLPLDTLLNNLTIAEKKRLNPITQQQTDNTARLTAYGTLKSALEKFQTANTALNKPELFRSSNVTSSSEDLKVTTEAGAAPGIYTISVTQLAAGINPINVSPNIKLGKNYDGSSQYAGMCPPVASGIHTYTVSLFALSGTAPNEPGGAGITRSQFRNSYGAYILGEGVLSGTYDRDNPTPTP